MSSALAPVILRTDHVSRAVGGKRIVSEATFDIHRGELLAIVGPSGSGKSSLLRLLNRLDEPTSGSVFLEEKDCREIPPRELRRRVGMVLQRPFLFPGSVSSNVRFGPAQRGQALSDSGVAALLDRVGLAGFEERDSATLSGGEAQRVSLARALANAPSVLLLDEPTSSLDDAAKRQVEDIIVQVGVEDRITYVMVTHDTAQAARLATRVLWMKAGAVERIGRPEEVSNAKTPV